MVDLIEIQPAQNMQRTHKPIRLTCYRRNFARKPSQKAAIRPNSIAKTPSITRDFNGSVPFLPANQNENGFKKESANYLLRCYQSDNPNANFP
jgi:hypothetical protein